MDNKQVEAWTRLFKIISAQKNLIKLFDVEKIVKKYKLEKYFWRK